MLILHFIGLAMGLGTTFAHAFLGMAVSKMTSEEAIKFRLHSLVLSKMGNIGIVLLIFSGLYLITPFWTKSAKIFFTVGKGILSFSDISADWELG